MVIVLALAVFAVLAASAGASSSTSATAIVKDEPRGLSLPFSSTSRYFDPALKDATGRVDVLVAVNSSTPTAEIAGLLKAPRAFPSIGDVRLVRGFIDASQVGALEVSPHVLAVLVDRPVQFDRHGKPAAAAQSRLPAHFRELQFPEPTSFAPEPLTGEPELFMQDVVNFTGARRAWTQLGVDGAGVTIAVVDTGVDFGAFNLGESAVARDAAGVPTSFDPDGSTLAWTFDRVTAIPCGPGVTCVTTAGLDPLIYVFDLFGAFGPYGPAAYPFSFFFGVPFPADMQITGLPMSLSGNYRFGILFEFNFFIDFFPVLLIDTAAAGVYDTAVLDLSFDWWLNGFSPGPLPDFSFADESLLRPTVGGNVVAKRDMNADGYPDISAGSLAHGLDVWGLDPTPPDELMILKPIDRNGDYMTMMFDPWDNGGHGTWVAASAAGRESNHPTAGPGIAPGAKIMGVRIFAAFDILEGWLWAAGFDLVGRTTARFVPSCCFAIGEWTYTGNHKADIISNSWGFVGAFPFMWLFGFPWYDVVTVLEDALMTPGYADPGYPGTVFVHSAGNKGAAYGTVSHPAWNSLAITAGASTNLNFTSLPFGGFHYDVIHFSSRGPNAYGAPKPDVLQVGAFAVVAGPPWAGVGSGFFAYNPVFGGTSLSAPLTSGSAAVLIQAYKGAHGGAQPSPFMVKSILKSTSVDLGYDAFVQGAGHVDVYNAAAYAKGVAGILTTTSATWDNLRPWVASPWASAHAFYGEQVGSNPPAGPISDTSWFAASVNPGGSTSAEFTIAPATGTVSGSISAVWHNRLAGSLTLGGTTTVLGAGWLEGYGALVPLTTPIPAAADLMVVRGIMPYSFLDPDGNYLWDNRSRIVVGDWVDANSDTLVQPSEVKVFNYGYNTGTTVEARVGLPNGRFSGTPLLWFSQVPCPGPAVEPGPSTCPTARSFVPMVFSIRVEFYDRLPWSWITAPATFTASAASPATWTATLAVPAGTKPGVYEGQIIVTPTSGNATAVPVSVVVPATIGPGTLSTIVTSSGSTQIYDPSAVNGYFDWRGVYEAGDWKLWFVDVTDPTTIALRADVSWTGALTDVDIWSLRPDTIPIDSSFSPKPAGDPFGGRFIRSTRTGTPADFVVASTTNVFAGQPNPGLYTFALHNVLLGAGPTPETLTGTVSAAKLSPRGPVTVVAQPGRVVSIPFTLSTGFLLSGISLFAYPPPRSSFPQTAEPGFTPSLAAGGSMTAWLNISVPAGTADGMYQNFMSLGASPLVSAFVPVFVVVDATNPVVSILVPGSGDHVRGTVTIEAVVADANNAASVTFTAGSSSGALARDSLTGRWTGSWATAGTPDGPVVVAVTATDTAGNVATSSRSVTIDNTPPTASFSAPTAGTWVRGTVVSFSVADTNLASATLAYGGTSVDVTGQSSASVNTVGLADGAQTLTLTAVDQAGNSRIATLSLNVDNTAPTAVITSPAAATYLRGSVTVMFVADDANVATATLTLGTLPSIDVTGRTSQLVNTAGQEGSKTLTLTVTDMAGNTATDAVTVTVDNAAPTVSISSPSDGQNLRGSATITWSATDANPDKVWLTIDGEQRDVTGTTSFTWDTSTVGDGAHDIEVTAIDKAGNVGTSSVTVTTDNVAQAVSTSFNNGLLIAGVSAAIVGFLIGWFIGRRRKPKPQEAMPPMHAGMQQPPPPPPPKPEEEL